MAPDNSNSLYKTEAVVPGKQNNYETAYREAAARLAPITIGDIAARSGSRVGTDPGKALLLPFLGDELLVTHPEITVSYNGRGEEVPMWVKILSLHYLVRSGGAPERGDQVTFKQLEGGLGYYPAFQRRSITPLLEAFGNDMDRLLKKGMAAGGLRSTLGDHALLFRAFPRVEVTFLFWKGDDEFPPSGSVVFDSSISDYLSTEDVAVLCNMIAVRILKTPLG